MVPAVAQEDMHVSMGKSQYNISMQEHCLMGIKGTVRRNQDSHVIHSNVDTDIIVAEEFPFGSTRKPDEMYSVIEHFCLVSILCML